MPSAADAFSHRRALSAVGLLADFNRVGVVVAADVHVARRLCDLLDEPDGAVRLAVALAVRAPRLGHVHVDLATVAATATAEPFGDEPVDSVDVAALPWPGEDWVGRVSVSRMVSDGPLRLEGSRLYLDRYWREEVSVARDLNALAGPADVDEDRLADGLARLFTHDPGGDQSAAATAVLRNRLAIIAGGPGTGKTTTVARVLALLHEQGDADEPPLVALAAPTGKAQSRLQAAIAEEVDELDVAPAVRERIAGLQASTLHRLLGWRPDNRSRFRHHRGEKLPHDVVIIDETSMVSLSQMARLVEAIRPGARLILVGDERQLASVEAGAVLDDIVSASGAPAAAGLSRLAYVHRHRDGGAIAALGRRIAAGDASGALALLAEEHEDLAWLPDGDADLHAPALAAARAVRVAAQDADAAAALDALSDFRILCAHRREVAVWTDRIEAGLDLDVRRERFYVGRPLLVTSNDYDLGLFNGESGVVVDPVDPRAVFERGNCVGPARLGAVDTAFAMTIHKAQGSQFGTAAVVLPDPSSRILTRELLYTACTRAQSRLILAGSEASIRTAIERPIARASGLRDRLMR